MRRTLGATASLSLIVVALVCYRHAPAEPATGGLTAASADGSTARTGRAYVPRVARPAAEPGITTVGIHLAATLRADGEVEIVETVRFRRSVTLLELSTPRSSYGGPAFADTSPTAERIRLAANDEPVTLSFSQVRRSRTVELPTASQIVVLRYLLTDATVRGMSTVRGRVLGLVTPLTRTVDPTLPTSLTIAGGVVRSLTCPRLDDDRRQCARPDNPAVAVRLTAGDAVFIVQFDLPPPS